MYKDEHPHMHTYACVFVSYIIDKEIQVFN